MPKVSVVIPVYNVEKYLRQCLDSVVNQTLRDVEIICVDDGSTDSSQSILQAYAARECRMKVYRQANAGQSVARNRGLSKATGEYLLFLDSDDWLLPETLFELTSKMDMDQLDQCLFSAEVFADSDDGSGDVRRVAAFQEYYAKLERSTQACLSGPELLATLAKTYSLVVSVPLRMFRTQILKAGGLEFPVGLTREDEYYAPMSLMMAKRACVFPRRFYQRRVRANSTMTASSPSSVAGRVVNYALVCLRLARDMARFQGDPTCANGRLFVNVRNAEALARQIAALPAEALAIFDDRIRELGIRSAVRAYMATPNPVQRCENPLVSVIVPVYNVEKYISHCLDTLIGQQYKDLEIICVDDGSTDGSADLLAEYAFRDYRINVLTQENSGPGAARNNGLRVARGKYVLFVDADDFVSPDTIGTLLNEAERSVADVVVFGMKNFDAEASQCVSTVRVAHWVSHLPCPFSAEQAADRIFSSFLPGPCNKMFLKSHINEQGLEFPSLRRCEDVAFVFSALVSASRIVATDRVFYNYRRGRVGSLETDGGPVAILMLEAYGLVCQRLKAQGRYELFLTNFTRALVSSYLYTLGTIHNSADAVCFWDAARSGRYADMFRTRLPESSFFGNEREWRRYERLIDSSCLDAFLLGEISYWKEIALAKCQGRTKRKDVVPKAVTESGNVATANPSVGLRNVWLFKKVRGGRQCFRENGLHYTLWHFVGKVMRRLGRDVNW